MELNLAASLPKVSTFIAETMGLHFPRERWADLQRGLNSAAAELGFKDVAACSEWLLSASLTKAHMDVLASHLTVGETYFFRDGKLFDILANRIIPELVRSRRGREQRLRLWSAACCTGEEPYSLAIMLQQVIPDLQSWHVSILATDINPRFLRKACAGLYGEWSFRDCPAGFKERYFHRTLDGRYAIVPQIKERVTFAHLNLVHDVYPSVDTDTNAMDLIICRNVLMYFTPSQMRKVIGKLHSALLDGGWLAVSPSEASRAYFPQFTAHNHPGVILYEKGDETDRDGQPRTSPAIIGPAELNAPVFEAPVIPITLAPSPPPPNTSSAFSPERSGPEDTSPAPYDAGAAFYQQGRYADAEVALLASMSGHTPEPREVSLLARALANQGRLADALMWCDRWIAADKLNPAGHYLRAVILLEQGDREQSRRSLQRAIYLQPGFVLAHFVLGNIARTGGKEDEAGRHFANALHLLNKYRSNDLLPESDGLTAARLTESITSMNFGESVP